jgi:hypothetical protein
MWDLYSKRDAGVAIQSTYRRLSKSLDTNNEHTVYIGKVQYVDFDTIWISPDNIYRLFLIKRKSFEHEQELRAIRDLPSDDPEDKIVGKGLRAGHFFIGPDIKPVNKSTLTERGNYVPIDLEVIVKIYVAPLAQDYFYEAVTSVAQRFGIDKKPFIKSDLYSLK